ncbi:MAG: hypothetical protein JXB88_07845 [Spirochaetales bacterium]|nr:hypothetical protein [Spirochaetales bacterium]
MKYRLLKSEKIPVPAGDNKIIYIIPLSSSHKQYAVIYPAIPAGQLLDDIFQERVGLHRFRGCPDNAVGKVKQALIDMIHSELKQSSAKQSSMWIIGIALIGFGVFDLFLPDPLILVDELLILAGGGWILASGLKLKKIHTVLKDKHDSIVKKITGLPVIEDNLCSGIFASIQAKDERLMKEFKENFSIESVKDRIEVETRWYVDYINIEELINTGQVLPFDVRNIMNGLDCIIPLKKIVYLEEKIHNKMVKGENTARLSRKLKIIKNRANRDYGFSEDALTVYSEFYKSASAYFFSKGEKL